MILGGLGWLLDRWLGTWPVFVLFFFVFTLGYVVWKMFVRYEHEMRTTRHGCRRAGASQEPSTMSPCRRPRYAAPPVEKELALHMAKRALPLAAGRSSLVAGARRAARRRLVGRCSRS